MARHIVLDIESRSQLNLKKVGAERYARDPSTDIWCVGYAVDDQPAELWRPGEPVPPAIIEAVADPDYLFVAHNAAFERAIWQHVLSPKHGWPEPPQ